MQNVQQKEVKGAEMKVVNFQISDELHKEMRLEAVRQEKSVKQFITGLIEKELGKEEENAETD